MKWLEVSFNVDGELAEALSCYILLSSVNTKHVAVFC